MVQKAKTPTTAADRIRGLNNHKSTLYGIGRAKFSPITSGTGTLPNLGGSAGGSTTAAGNFVRTEGDTMVGPLAFFPKLVSIASDEIDISDTSGNYSSRVIVAPETGSTDDLTTISGAAYAGQILFLQGVQGNTITLKNSGNIETIDGSDFSLEDDDILLFMYDTTDTAWQQITIGKQGTGGGSGASFPLDYSIDDQGTKSSGTVTHDLSATTAHMLKFTIGGDVTIAFSNYPASGTGIDWYVEVTQDGTGGHTITWPAAVTPAISLSETASTTSLVAFHTNDNGTTVRSVTLLNATAATAGANKQLDNLGTTSINSHLIPQAGKTLGDSGNLWSSVWQNNTKFGTAGVIDSTINQIAGSSTGMLLNIPTSKTYDFQANGSNVATLTDGGILTTNGLITTGALGALALGDTTSYPGFNGAIYREGSDVKIYTGGSEVNVTSLITSPLTTKGDLFGYDTGDNRIPVGTNGHVLTADSTEALGVKWAAVSASGLATTELDNLGTTAINASLLLDTDNAYDLGASAQRLRDVFAHDLRIGSSGAGVGGARQIYGDAGGVVINFPTSLNLTLQENNVDKITVTATTMTGLETLTLDNLLQLNDFAAYPASSGQFARNGTTTSLYAPEFEIKNQTSVAAENAALHLTKVDSTPLDNENIGEINFIVRDTGVETIYAAIQGYTDDVTDSGALVLQVRADNSLSSALTVFGDDNNTQYAHSYRDESRLFPVTGNMLFSVKAQSGLNDFTSNVGTSGTIIIPFINDGSPSLTDLNSAFGAFDGAIGLDISDGKLYVRNSSSAWNYYSRDGTVT